MSLYIILLSLYTVAGGEESIVLVILLHEEHLGEENHEGRNTGATFIRIVSVSRGTRCSGCGAR